MSIFLTYSVYAVRTSGDLPIQSDFLPLISLYFVITMGITLLTILWFFLCNYMITRKTMPRFLIRFSRNLYRIFKFNWLKRCFNKLKPKVRVNTTTSKSVLQDGKSKIEVITIKEMERQQKKFETEFSFRISLNENMMKEKQVLVFDHENDIDPQEIVLLASYLNYFALFIFFCAIFANNLTLWLLS